jgi:hypothetical protein
MNLAYSRQHITDCQPGALALFRSINQNIPGLYFLLHHFAARRHPVVRTGVTADGAVQFPTINLDLLAPRVAARSICEPLHCGGIVESGLPEHTARRRPQTSCAASVITSVGGRQCKRPTQATLRLDRILQPYRDDLLNAGSTRSRMSPHTDYAINLATVRQKKPVLADFPHLKRRFASFRSIRAKSPKILHIKVVPQFKFFSRVDDLSGGINHGAWSNEFY